MKVPALHAPQAIRIAILAAFCLPATGLQSAFAQGAQTAEISRRLSFSGMLDADFASEYGTFDAARHYTGLEADLVTQLLFTPTLTAVVRTTMRDGSVPRQGAGNTWAPLRFDGAQVNWQPGKNTVWMAGDLVLGSGYFQYARYKRTAAVVGEHSLRGAGFRRGGIELHAGMAADTAGEPGDWSVAGKWTRPMGAAMTWTPSFRYTKGIPNANPFELGVSFEGSFEETIDLHVHVGMNFWNPDTDPGSMLLVEPRYAFGRYFVATTVFYSNKGEVPSPNAPRLTAGWEPLDDFLLQVEPGMALDKTFATGVALEYRNRSFDDARDESLWLTPRLYVYPAPRAEWHVWTGLEKPLVSGAAGNPRFALGSEIMFAF